MLSNTSIYELFEKVERFPSNIYWYLIDFHRIRAVKLVINQLYVEKRKHTNTKTKTELRLRIHFKMIEAAEVVKKNWEDSQKCDGMSIYFFYFQREFLITFFLFRCAYFSVIPLADLIYSMSTNASFIHLLFNHSKTDVSKVYFYDKTFQKTHIYTFLYFIFTLTDYWKVAKNLSFY